MADDRGTFDIECADCGIYLFSGEWERPFSRGSEHLLEKDHYCKKCRKKHNNSLKAEAKRTGSAQFYVRRTKMTDTERLNWLEENEFSLVSNDMGWWACVVDGMQNVPEKLPDDIHATFFIEKSQWSESIRNAVDNAIRDHSGPPS